MRLSLVIRLLLLATLFVVVYSRQFPEESGADSGSGWAPLPECGVLNIFKY